MLIDQDPRVQLAGADVVRAIAPLLKTDAGTAELRRVLRGSTAETRRRVEEILRVFYGPP